MSEQDGTGAPVPEIDDETLDLYVLGALDADESAVVAAAITSDPGLAARAAQSEEVLAMIGSSVPVTPPPSMRAAVLASLDDAPQERPDVPERVVAPERPGPTDDAGPTDDLAARRARRDAPAQAPTRRSAMRYAVAAAAVVVAGTGGVAAWIATRSGQEDAVAAARERIDAAPDAQVVPASGASSGPWVRSELRWSASVGEAVITSPDRLPLVTDGVYQVWRVTDGEDGPSPVVDFNADGPDGPGGVVVPGGAASSAAIAVSRESGPGATTPTKPLVATYALST